MKALLFPAMRTIVLCLMAVTLAGTSLANPSFLQDKDKKAAQVSGDEQKALGKLESASDVNAKMTAAGEFIKKYPKSIKRLDAAKYISNEISKAEPAARITLAQNFLNIFTDTQEAGLITPILVDAYLTANKPDEAFKTGAAYLEKNPDDAAVLAQLGYGGIDQARRQNPAYAQQGITYTTKAIALIEADKMPVSYSPDKWAEFKTQWQPLLYQALGLAAYMSDKKDEAKAKFEKASSLNPAEPFNYAMLGSLANEEYQVLADRHKTMMSGPLKDETLKRANVKIDEVIEHFARTVALSEGKPAYQSLHDQILKDLTEYYKYRHNNSADGLQAFIDKYKKPAQ
jgi:hypothetical protein